MSDLGTLDPNGTSSQAKGVSNGKAFRWVGNDSSGTMLELSGVPGIVVSSGAAGVSADGLTIVGRSVFQPPGQSPVTRAFRWTAADGMQSLGVVPGDSSSEALAISDDGLTIVGRSGNQAFVWRADVGMCSVANVLTCAGVDLTGWTIGKATGVSADGLTIVGMGGSPSGAAEGWIAKMPPLLLTAESERFHAAGENGIAGRVPAGGSECRNIDGTVNVVIKFDRDAFSSDGDSFVAGDFTVQNGTVTNASGGPKTVLVDIANVIDKACLSISFIAEDADGNETCYQVEWPILLGDANNDGVVDASDEALLTSKDGQTLPATDFRCDLNFNGTIQTDPQADHSDLDLVVVTSPPATATCP